MTTFYVGQRVRVVRPERPENYGLEGTFRGYEFLPKGTPTMGDPLPCDCDCSVSYDAYPGGLFPESTDCIEPITNLDNTATTWDAMPCDRNGKFKGIPA